MDIHKIHHEMKAKRSRKTRGVVRKPYEKDVMKVVYISTPMKVKTSASKFMQIVQELTGRESDVVKIMEKCDEHNNYNHNYNNNNNNYSNTWIIPNYSNSNSNSNNSGDYYYYGNEELITTSSENPATVQNVLVSGDKTSPDTSNSSEEFIGSFDEVYMKDEQSFGLFDHPHMLYDSIYNQIDALGSY